MFFSHGFFALHGSASVSYPASLLAVGRPLLVSRSLRVSSCSSPGSDSLMGFIPIGAMDSSVGEGTPRPLVQTDLLDIQYVSFHDQALRVATICDLSLHAVCVPGSTLDQKKRKERKKERKKHARRADLSVRHVPAMSVVFSFSVDDAGSFVFFAFGKS